MTISVAGSIGIGLVAGWLSARMTGFTSILWLVVAFLLIVLEVIVLLGLERAIYMVLSAALTFIIHSAWLHYLVSRY